MNRGIVITTSEYTKDWLPECLESLKDCKYPILVVSNGKYKPQTDFPTSINQWNGWELGGIQRGAEYFDEFIHLMDTCVVTDPAMFDMMFEEKGSVYLCDGFFSYLGKYKSEIVNQLGVPHIETKAEAIEMEREWNRQYIKRDTEAKHFDPQLPIHTTIFTQKNGRRNMVLDNGFVIKYKGTWS